MPSPPCGSLEGVGFSAHPPPPDVPLCPTGDLDMWRLREVQRATVAGGAKTLQSRPTLCNPKEGSPPGSSVPEVLQARILEWGAIPFSWGSSPPRDSLPLAPPGKPGGAWAERHRDLPKS